jgi:hypothetical protein
VIQCPPLDGVEYLEGGNDFVGGKEIDLHPPAADFADVIRPNLCCFMLPKGFGPGRLHFPFHLLRKTCPHHCEDEDHCQDYGYLFHRFPLSGFLFFGTRSASNLKTASSSLIFETDKKPSLVPRGTTEKENKLIFTKSKI